MSSHPMLRRRKRARYQVSAVTPSEAPSLLPNISGSSVPTTRGPSQELVIRRHSVHLSGKTGDWGRRRMTIDILPDDVLLEIFDIDTMNKNIHRWHTLVHVCRRWRTVVFASTHRLNLQLRCTYTAPTRKTLDVWPELPIIIEDGGPKVKGASNIIAAFKHPDRVHRIDLGRIPSSVLKRFAAAMKKPFPNLTYLGLGLQANRNRKTAPVLPALPDSFLGGSAPCLRELQLYGIPFLAIPKLLSSASGLVYLFLFDIPHSGYISPEAMASGLSTLTRLEKLWIGFQSHRSRPDKPSPPRSIRTILPALNRFEFRGVSEYLDDLTSRIDAPLLSDFPITFFNQLIFNTPRLSEFIGRAESLRHSHAYMTFTERAVSLSHTTPRGPGLSLSIQCNATDWQLSSLAQFCGSPFLSLFNIERLELHDAAFLRPHWQEDVEHTQWLEVLRPFTTLKYLSLWTEFTLRVVLALQEFSEDGMMDVLPALQSIFLPPESSLSGPVKEALEQFVTARRLSGHSVAVNPRG